MSDELFRKMKIAPGSRLPPGGRLGRRGNKNQVDSRLIEKIWRPYINLDYEKHSPRKIGSAIILGNRLLDISPWDVFELFHWSIENCSDWSKTS